jgi:hypothetical protein
MPIYISGYTKIPIGPRINPFLNRETEYEPLKILPWNEDQVEQFLQRRVPLIKGADQPWTYYRDQIKKIGSLSDLSQRPVLLDMIVKTLPRLISSGEAINLPKPFSVLSTDCLTVLGWWTSKERRQM